MPTFPELPEVTWLHDDFLLFTEQPHELLEVLVQQLLDDEAVAVQDLDLRPVDVEATDQDVIDGVFLMNID